MKNHLFRLAVLVIVLSLTGCGYIYTHTIEPFDVNLDRTPFVVDSEEGDIKHFHYYVDVVWDSNAIGDIAKREGIDAVYFVDLEVLKVLGIWKQYTVHIYGK
ncbi:MAG: hypothetical protein JRF30_07430 [Deltaproteobacteria bacterium]|nr:hypothetical protein [Deltaproteobacteria bacterium]